MATSVADGTQAAASTINLSPLVTVGATPAVATLYPGKSEQFYAKVTGATDQSVTWSLAPAAGTVSSSGLYKAPATIPARQTVTLTAQSSANPNSKFRIPIVLNPTPVQFSVGASGLTSLAYNGKSYFEYITPIIWNVTFQSPDGTQNSVPTSNPNPVNVSGSTVTQVYNNGGANQFTVQAVYTAYDYRTIEADVAITNNDATNTISQFYLNPLLIRMPGPDPKVKGTVTLTVNQYNGVPLTFMSGNWGSVAAWMGDYPTNVQQVSLNVTSAGTRLWNMIQSASNWGPHAYATQIAPGQTVVVKQWVRFGAPNDTAATLAPEAYAVYRAGQPSLMTWPDRRPIAQWFLADMYSGRSATNPRGYLWDKTIDISDSSTFQTKVLARANGVLSIMNAMSPKPQGIILWDLEGQEFNQPFTYVGYPNNLPLLAPEMDAIADQMIGIFTSAGYRIGMTVRPQTFGIGDTLPVTCNYNSNWDLMDKFVDTSASYPYRGYWCAAPNQWYAASANHLLQSSLGDYNAVESLLASKISYAKNRWGATLFYIDSAVWEGGSPLDPQIFRDLQAQFPDCLLIPEQSNDLTFSAAAPLEQAAALGYYGTRQSTRSLYPNAFGVLNTADGNWTQHFTSLVDSIVCGDIPMFRGWFSSAEIPFIEKAYTLAPRTAVPGCTASTQ